MRDLFAVEIAAPYAGHNEVSFNFGTVLSRVPGLSRRKADLKVPNTYAAHVCLYKYSLIPLTEICRLPALIGTILWPFAFAQRACCAAEIFARAATLILRGPRDVPLRSDPPSALIAVSRAFNCPAIFAPSAFNCEMMSIIPSQGGDCNRVLRYSGPSAARIAPFAVQAGPKKDSFPCVICHAKHFSQLLAENDFCRRSSLASKP